jgi:prepilin-type N-terminal cleavage/methylation domain-containing protein
VASESRGGFSLVEVLVALAIGGVCMTAVAHSAWSIVRGRRQTELRETATRLVERRLEKILARGAEALYAETDSETVFEPLGDFELRSRVEEGPRENLWHVSVTATASRSGASVGFHSLLRRRWVKP